MPDAQPAAATRITGGCQCGAVRYALSASPDHLNVCHCRMCQKASGGPFMVFGGVATDQIEWTRGTPSLYRSSSYARRGFCAACGTPLTYQSRDEAISITLGSLDDPACATPAKQLGMEARLPWLDDLAAIPGDTTYSWMSQDTQARFVSHQHPDHDD